MAEKKDVDMTSETYKPKVTLENKSITVPQKVTPVNVTYSWNES